MVYQINRNSQERWTLSVKPISFIFNHWLDSCRFKVDRWFNDALGTYADLLPEQPKPISPEESTVPRADQALYKITIVTSSANDSGTDSGVFLTIYGDQGQTKQFPLIDTKQDSELLFKAGETREFQVELNDVGKVGVRRLIVSHRRLSFDLDWEDQYWSRWQRFPS